MTRQTVGHLLQSCVMALTHHGGDALLSMGLPKALIDAASAGPITVERGDRFALSRGLAVVPVRGLLTPNMFMFERYMGWATYQGIEETMAELAADTDCRAAVLDMDSPGGMVRGIEGAAEAIAALAAVKPVHVLVNPLSASAAYWLASQGTDITVTPGAELGCIGTRLVKSSPQKTDNWGDLWFEVSSSNARAKNPNPATEVGMAELQRMLDESEARFHAAVAAGRGIDPAALAQQLSVTDDPQDGGAVFPATEAITRGLADGLETREAFYGRLTEAYAPPAPRTQSRAFAARAAAAQAMSAT
ncbi:MAG: S49 family peptidase [Paracoccaceae bacterium]